MTDHRKNAQFMALYFSMTGLHLPYSENEHASDLFLFFKKYSENDFILVIKHLKKRYGKNQEILLRMFSFTKLIRQLDVFGETLAEANAMAVKHRKPSERDKTLMATGRAPEGNVERPARSARQVLRRMSKEQLAEGWAAVKAGLDAPTEPEEPELPPAA